MRSDVISSMQANGFEFYFLNVTPDFAKGCLERNIDNRKLKARVADRYATDMSTEGFLFTGDPIRFDRNGKLIDGQHRLTAVIQSGTPVTMLVIYGLDPEVQKVIDQGAKRSLGDTLELEGLSKDSEATVKRLMVYALDGDMSMSSASRHTNTEYLNYARSLDESLLQRAIQVSKSLAKTTHLSVRTDKGGIKALIAPSVAASLYYVLAEIDKPAAAAFFHRLVANAHLSDDDPIKALVKALGGRIDYDRHGDKAKHQMALVFKAWNFFRAGRGVKVLRWSPSESTFPVPK